MTEREWLDSEDLRPMLAWLRGRASERKLRLFACACCRRVWHLLHHPVSRAAVCVAELYAEDGRTEQHLAQAQAEASAAARAAVDRVSSIWLGSGGPSYRWARAEMDRKAAEAAAAVAVPSAWDAALTVPFWVEDAGVGITAWPLLDPHCGGWRHEIYKELRRLRGAARTACCELLRDVFGPLPVRGIPALRWWLAWEDGVVARLAQGIYHEGAFERLPILADALEDAGCTSADILEHCRGPGPHVRGCWVLDLLLEKT
jgi:hypothetical protein